MNSHIAFGPLDYDSETDLSDNWIDQVDPENCTGAVVTGYLTHELIEVDGATPDRPPGWVYQTRLTHIIVSDGVEDLVYRRDAVINLLTAETVQNIEDCHCQWLLDRDQ